MSCLFLSCKEASVNKLTAQQIIDKSIEASGGHLLNQSEVSFVFRNVLYKRSRSKMGKVLERIFKKDSNQIRDVYSPKGFVRYVNNEPVSLADSTTRKYQNSINSVHYFAYLPEGLNDKAVIKKLLGETQIKEAYYYVVEVTFNEEDGGDDFDDVYLYWFNKESFKADYLAYQFSVNDGGVRFREAYNERIINGIRFVDYKNYGEDGDASVYEVEEKFIQQRIPLKSSIILEDIKVSQDSYN